MEAKEQMMLKSTKIRHAFSKSVPMNNFRVQALFNPNILQRQLSSSLDINLEVEVPSPIPNFVDFITEHGELPDIGIENENLDSDSGGTTIAGKVPYSQSEQRLNHNKQNLPRTVTFAGGRNVKFENEHKTSIKVPAIKSKSVHKNVPYTPSVNQFLYNLPPHLLYSIRSNPLLTINGLGAFSTTRITPENKTPVSGLTAISSNSTNDFNINLVSERHGIKIAVNAVLDNLGTSKVKTARISSSVRKPMKMLKNRGKMEMKKSDTMMKYENTTISELNVNIADQNINDLIRDHARTPSKQINGDSSQRAFGVSLFIHFIFLLLHVCFCLFRV